MSWLLSQMFASCDGHRHVCKFQEFFKIGAFFPLKPQYLYSGVSKLKATLLCHSFTDKNRFPKFKWQFRKKVFNHAFFRHETSWDPKNLIFVTSTLMCYLVTRPIFLQQTCYEIAHKQRNNNSASSSISLIKTVCAVITSEFRNLFKNDFFGRSRCEAQECILFSGLRKHSS